MMRSLAQEITAERIRCHCPRRTPINNSTWETAKAARRLLTLIPYGRIGEPEDIARVAVWRASDDPDDVVGATPFVDAGMKLHSG